MTTQGIENKQVFKSENTLTGCKIPAFLQSETHKKDVLAQQKQEKEQVKIEYKLMQYTQQARCKAHDPQKQISDADRRFK